MFIYIAHGFAAEIHVEAIIGTSTDKLLTANVWKGFPGGGSDSKESICSAEAWVCSLGWEKIIKEIRKYFEMNKDKKSKKTSGMQLKKCLGCSL